MRQLPRKTEEHVAAFLHAKAENSDPFAYARKLANLKQTRANPNAETPRDVIEVAADRLRMSINDAIGMALK